MKCWQKHAIFCSLLVGASLWMLPQADAAKVPEASAAVTAPVGSYAQAEHPEKFEGFVWRLVTACTRPSTRRSTSRRSASTSSPRAARFAAS